MAQPAKPKRKKDEPERINLDEWGNAGALDGLLSFLNIAPDQAPVNQGSRKVLNLLEQRTQERTTDNETGTVSKSDSLPVIERAPVILSPGLDGPSQAEINPSIFKAPSPQPEPSITGTLPFTDTQPQWNHPKQATGFGNKKLYRCTLAQDGHSHTEEALYQVLWRSGKPENDDARLTVMGYGEMSKRVRLSFNNTKAACRRLISKFAIEEVAREISDKRQGKTYRVFSYRAILERRRASGLEWVIRNKGVEFVTPLIGALSISDTLPVIDRVPETSTGTASKKGRGTPSETGTLLEKSFRKDLRESSSADIVSLIQALSDYGQPDDDVAHSMLARCQAVAPDCTPAEIIHFVHEKGKLIRQDRTRRITSPLGFLLTAVPKCLTGETFERYRNQERIRLEQERLRQERQQAEIEQWRREQEAILNDPNASEEDKQFARQVLGA
jgi:hypothetical protein